MNRTEQIKNFSSLYGKYYKRSYCFTYSYIHNEEVAEDIASDSLIKLWEKMCHEEVGKPLHLLFVILRNRSLDYLRQCKLKEEVHESLSALHKEELDFRINNLQACDPEEIFSEEVYSILEKTLAGLPEQTRRVFEMSRFDQLSGKEIAEELGITVKGVEYHITKALKVLRVELRDYLPLFYFLFN